MNSLAIAVIIGIITSIYRKNMKAKKRTTEAKPFSTNLGNLQDIYSKLKETAIPNDPSFMQIEPAQSEQVKWESADQEIQINDVSPINISNKKATIAVEVEKTNHDGLFNGPEDNKKLVDAVIWSEILGKPRAKRPYYAKNR